MRGTCAVAFGPQAMLLSVYLLYARAQHACFVLCILIRCCCYVSSVTTQAANTPGLYYEYYNAGISPTPITGMPDWSRLTAATSSFQASTTGNIGNPQLSSRDTYCGGYYHGYLYLTVDGSSLPYILGLISKDGGLLAVDGSTLIAQNSKSRSCLLFSKGQPR